MPQNHREDTRKLFKRFQVTNNKHSRINSFGCHRNQNKPDVVIMLTSHHCSAHSTHQLGKHTEYNSFNGHGLSKQQNKLKIMKETKVGTIK